MRTFDPEWLRKGEFFVGHDGRPSRTELVRDEMNRLERTKFSMHLLRDQGHSAAAYYLRVGARSGAEAQYFMQADPHLRTLVLGLSIEKGEEGTRASIARRMDRPTWDWPRLVELADDDLLELLHTVSKRLGRAVSIVVDYHLVDDEGAEQTRFTVPYTLFDGLWWKRGARTAVDEVCGRLREIDAMKDWWSDVLVVADYDEHEVEKMDPQCVAAALHAFAPLRDVLRKQSS